MAASTHTTSRRALLAVLSAAPLLALPAMSTAPTGKWQALVARESAARNAFRGSKGLSEDAYDALVEAHNVALRAMLDCPAPTMAALAHKLATIGREDGWMMTDEDDAGVLPVLIADAQRLAASVH